MISYSIKILKSELGRLKEKNDNPFPSTDKELLMEYQIKDLEDSIRILEQLSE